jgi:hypothetical protein
MNSDLKAAVNRMCEPLDPSRLSGVTAQEDARCMAVIRVAIEQLEADNAALRALLVEWEDGMYDGQDFLRRVRLALHGDKGLTDAAMREGKG